MRGTTDLALSLCMVYVSGPEISSLKFKRKKERLHPGLTVNKVRFVPR